MSRARTLVLLVMALAVAGEVRASAVPDTVRLWILPFENAAAEPAGLLPALPELMTLFISQAGLSVVEREHLDRILAEHALSREGLVAPAGRRRMARLLGATAMITGSFAREGNALILTAHVTDIASGRVRASANAAGGEDHLAETVQKLCRDLVAGLRDSASGPAGTPVDHAPLQDLHFMRGLSHFGAARYHQALAEFIQCDRQGERGGLPGLWRANCYLACEEFELACLELLRLKRDGAAVNAAEIERKLQSCLAHLSPEQVQTCRRLVAAGPPR